VGNARQIVSQAIAGCLQSGEAANYKNKGGYLMRGSSDVFKQSVTTTSKKGKYSKDEIDKSEKNFRKQDHSKACLILAYRQKMIHLAHHVQNDSDNNDDD
jgi:hypothetical protein